MTSLSKYSGVRARRSIGLGRSSSSSKKEEEEEEEEKERAVRKGGI